MLSLLQILVIYLVCQCQCKVSDNFSVSLQGINVLDEEQVMRRTNSTVTFVSSTGPKWSLSAKYNF